MEIEEANIVKIKNGFSSISSKKDLVILLNMASELLYGNNTKEITIKQLHYFGNPQFCINRYSQFSIRKKTGGVRNINAPVLELRSILRVLNIILQCVFEPHKAATGFIPNKSIVDNAKKHVGHHYVYNLDLKDFFHSFDRKIVKYGFMQAPFNLNGSDEKEEVAFLMAALCTHPIDIDGETRVILPQGSPTSPTITNILCYKLDLRLTGLSKRFGLTYTRYADDLTFSSNHNIYNKEKFILELKRIIEEDQLLKINPKKTRLQKSGYRQEVTGLIVNEKVNVRRTYLKQIRMWLYYWEKYGYEKAQLIFGKDYIADKGHINRIIPELTNVLDGKLEFLKMVKGEEDSSYLILKKRFDELSGAASPLNKVLDIWEKEGIEKAMELFNQLR